MPELPEQSMLFFIFGTLMIFYSSILEYINLNTFSKKDLLKDDDIYNIDLIATRIYGVLKDPDNAKYYLYPYLWTMVILSVVGSLFFFKNGFLFNILTVMLLGFFYMQYKNFVYKIALRMEQNDIAYNYDNVYKELHKDEWQVFHKKIALKKFTKETLDRYGLESKKYGDIEYLEKVDLSQEKILSKYKDDEDILFKDNQGNIYDVLNYGKKRKHAIRLTTIRFSRLFSALNKEENISSKIFFSVIEAGTSSFILYLSIIGFDYTIV